MISLNDFYQGFRDPQTIRHLAQLIAQQAAKTTEQINIMEVCGGHTHTIMKYGLYSYYPTIFTLFMAQAVQCALCLKNELTMQPPLPHKPIPF